MPGPRAMRSAGPSRSSMWRRLRRHNGAASLPRLPEAEPGNESTNLTYMIFKQSLMNFDVGVASAGALFAVVLANIVAVFLIRIVGKNLD